MKNNYCVIMAGGIGSRFWPMSRTAHPKQFLDILGTGRTLLQQTYDRFLLLCPPENIYIVTNEDYTKLVKEQLPDLNQDQILSEPARKNTAPCAAYASYKIGSINPDAIIVIAPSDHLITKEETFVKAINSCILKAQEEDCLATLGIKPTRPDTGYGYIQFYETEWKYDKRLKKVKTFTEKPDHEMAKFFIESGDFLWNSGIFIWSFKSFVKALERHLPETAAVFKEGMDKYNTPAEKAFIVQAYAQCSSISIDYAIMEKADNVYVRSSAIGWSDLGTWGSLYANSKKDENRNAVVGNNVMLYESSNCIVNVPKNKLVVVQGLEDYIIVESDNILLICKKEDEQQIKTFVNEIKIKKGEKYI
ncbi:MAG: mannose-1-phosphate guanylyltransferase [Bacteroidetes bacterium]|nr:mannose-1-phosphate guanylyltransferase [Bacteroidota bacterium]HET6245595.1 mannose-1-phosphate guanylyltransferase [Bacteroidia bacterium]